jgi:hypothetical protein
MLHQSYDLEELESQECLAEMCPVSFGWFSVRYEATFPIVAWKKNCILEKVEK